MAIAADLPPELFPYILHHVRPSMLEEFGSQEKRGVVRHLASCSLTCLFWAHACRPKIFEAVQVHSIDDLHALSELVVNTPRRLTSISEYIQYAQLVQRLDERSWLHTLSLQPPLGVEVLTSTQTRVEACIVGPSSADLEVGPFTIHRLFADLPRTPPSHLLRCDTLLLQDCHFRTLGDFKRSLLAFYGLVSRQFRLHVVNSTLDNRIRVANGVIAGRPLKLLPCSFSIEARGCSNTVELAWTALACEEQMLCSRSYFIEPLPSLHLSDQRVIYKLSSIMHQSLDQSPVSAELIDTPIFEITIGGRSRFRPLKYREICSLCVYRQRALRNAISPNGPNQWRCTLYTFQKRDRTAPVRVTLVDVCPPSRSGCNKATEARMYPWDQVIDLLGSLPGLDRVRFKFDERDDLVQFMEASRPALTKLHDRIDLLYGGDSWLGHVVDFVTLEDTEKTARYG